MSDPKRSFPLDAGPSLEQLGAALAGKLRSAAEPYEKAAPEGGGETPFDASETADDACQLSPRSILEAMLFVGSPADEPLSSKHVADLMRGVQPAEIDELVRALNHDYASRNCPYRIEAAGAGYRLSLRKKYDRLRDKLRGKERRARLSLAAIEVLSAVAYRAPITADEIGRLRGKPSGHLLAQLVRRKLLRIERSGSKPRRTYYHTTPRFLALFGLANLEELPQSRELDET